MKNPSLLYYNRNLKILGSADEVTILQYTYGTPSSNFYLDQTEMHLNNIYHADPFSANTVLEAAKYEMKLQPQ